MSISFDLYSESVMAIAPNKSHTAASILDPEALKRRAEVQTELHDWGNTGFDEGLMKVCQSACDEASLSNAHADALADNIVKALAHRLRFYANRACYPEIAKQKISAPIIVTGLPRSGTTILHSLLAQDSAARSPLRWEIDELTPPPRTDTFETDPRIARATAAVEALPAEFRAMHAMGAQLPEECHAFLSLAFQSFYFWAVVSLPSYCHWLMHDAPARDAYTFHYQVLQHLQAFAPRDFWVLKSPPHLLWLDTILEIYPDARVVVTHRDPAEVLPSNASLINFLRKGSDTDNALQVGREQVEVWGTAVQRAMNYRATSKHANQFIDVQYSDFIHHPLGVVEKVYDHFHMPLNADTQSRMENFMRENKQGKHGKHDYSPEEFGLNAASIRKDFSAYIDQYNIRIK
jgi:hypothetical protein